MSFCLPFTLLRVSSFCHYGTLFFFSLGPYLRNTSLVLLHSIYMHSHSIYLRICCSMCWQVIFGKQLSGRFRLISVQTIYLQFCLQFSMSNRTSSYICLGALPAFNKSSNTQFTLTVNYNINKRSISTYTYCFVFCIAFILCMIVCVCVEAGGVDQ